MALKARKAKLFSSVLDDGNVVRHHPRRRRHPRPALLTAHQARPWLHQPRFPDPRRLQTGPSICPQATARRGGGISLRKPARPDVPARAGPGPPRIRHAFPWLVAAGPRRLPPRTRRTSGSPEASPGTSRSVCGPHRYLRAAARPAPAGNQHQGPRMPDGSPAAPRVPHRYGRTAAHATARGSASARSVPTPGQRSSSPCRPAARQRPFGGRDPGVP